MNRLARGIVIGCGAVATMLCGWMAVCSPYSTPQSVYTKPATSIQAPSDLEVLESGSGATPNTDNAEQQPVVETVTETQTRSLSFGTVYVDDNTIAKGTTVTSRAGVDGTEVVTYAVTYTDGVETAREVIGTETTKQPVNRIVARGTYVAPSAPAYQDCANGTYVNSAGNTVCRPVQSDTRPAGATARCRDGSYSYSQSRRGTCSRHGGVAQWY